MNKSELIEKVAKQAEVDKKTATEVLNAFEDVVLVTTKAGKEPVSWTGFLKFERQSKPRRKMRNPQNGEEITVAAKKAPKVTAGAAFKKVVNGESDAPKLKR